MFGVRMTRAARMLCAAAMLAGTAGLAAAQGAAPAPAPDPPPTDAPEAPARFFDSVTVSATLAPVTVGETPATVSVIDDATIARRMIETTADLVKFEPGVYVDANVTRVGLNGFNIRGIGGNRVMTRVDGVETSEQFDFGPFNVHQFSLDLDTLKTAEIVRSSASSLYGSDALGGVVAITSRRPEDLLRGDDRDAGVVRFGVASVDGSGSLTAVGATGTAAHGLLLGASVAQGHEADHSAAATVPDDPQEWHRRAVLASYGRELADGSLLRLIVQSADEQVATDVYSLLGRGRFNTTTELSGDDLQDRDSVVAQWEFGARLGLARGVLRAWTLDSAFDQSTVQVRGLATPVTREERRFRYGQSAWGLGADLEASFAPLDQRFGFGFEYSRSDTEEQRDGTRYDLTNNTVSNTILGEVFPVRDFPNSTVTELGAYAMDELALAPRLTLIPGLRYDRFELVPHPDAVYQADNPATTPTALRDEAISPKLALAWSVGDASDLFLQYAHGFRAPPFEDVNIGLDIPLFGYRAIPNPDLVPEESDGLELGWRWLAPRTRVEVALFRSDYDDLIESRVNLGVDPGSGLTIFQSQNLASARIEGVEASIEHQRAGPAGSRLRLRAALALVDGEDRSTGAPLNSVDPGELVASAALDAASGRWSLELIGTGVEAKDEVTDPVGTTLFRSPGYGVFDLYLNLRPNARLNVTLAVHNLADQVYWRWASVNGLAASDPVVPLLSASGRSASITFRVPW